jgi:chromate transporter
VALNASRGLLPASWRRIGDARSQRLRWVGYAVVGAVAAAWFGEYLVIALIACGVFEIVIRRRPQLESGATSSALVAGTLHVAAFGGLAALSWEAIKVGALSYGGGFVIVPLMQHDAVITYHWMTGPQFLNAVALGQVTPGPVVQTVAVVGYAAAGRWWCAARGSAGVRAVFRIRPRGRIKIRPNPRQPRSRVISHGAGPSVIGAIAGSAIPLARSLHFSWQIPVLLAVAVWLLVARRSVVTCLLIAGVVGIVVALVGVGV